MTLAATGSGAAREKQGLSREKVAEQLHLRFTIIKQLEEDQYASDISATFTKGYLKLYAKLLGIDEKPVLAAYQKLGTQVKEPAKLQSFSQKVARQASDQRLMWVTYLVLVLIDVKNNLIVMFKLIITVTI